MASEVVLPRLDGRAVIVVAAVCLVALLAPWPAFAASADADGLAPAGNWRQVSSDVFPDGWSAGGLLFTDPAHGWLFADVLADLYGPSVNLHTADGGRTWREQPGPFATDAYGERVRTVYDFPDSAHGWALTQWDYSDEYFAGVARTSDGGEHWEPVRLLGEDFSFLDNTWITFRGHADALDFSSARSGWVVGSEIHSGQDGWRGIVLHTSDGGRSWARYGLRPRDVLETVVATGPRSAVVEGYRMHEDVPHSFIMSTDDDGLTWSRRDFVGWSLELFDDPFSGPRTAWMSGRDVGSGSVQDRYVFLRTTDGGRTWEEKLSSADAMSAPVFLSRRLGVVQRTVRDGVLWRTICLVTMDGGETWSEGKISGVLPDGFDINDAFFRCAFVTPAVRWAVGHNNALWLWTPAEAPRSPVLAD